jgi:hypothetical protein
MTSSYRGLVKAGLAPLREGVFMILLIVIIFAILMEDWKIIMSAAITVLPFSS